MIWGRIARPHGNSGVVRARFSTNLPPKSFGGPVRVVSLGCLPVDLLYYGLLLSLFFDLACAAKYICVRLFSLLAFFPPDALPLSGLNLTCTIKMIASHFSTVGLSYAYLLWEKISFRKKAHTHTHIHTEVS